MEANRNIDSKGPGMIQCPVPDGMRGQAFTGLFFKRSDTIVGLSRTVHFFMCVPGAGAKRRKLRIH